MKKTPTKTEVKVTVKPIATVEEQFRALTFDEKVSVFGEIKKEMSVAFDVAGAETDKRREFISCAFKNLMGH